MKNPTKIFAGIVLAGSGFFAATVSANNYCGTDTNTNHVSQGRAYVSGYVYAKANGTDQAMGYYYSDSTTLQQTGANTYEVVESCDTNNTGGTGAGDAVAYEHAEETPMETLIDKTGNYNLVTTGGHFVTSSSGGIPWDQPINCDGASPDPECAKSITIPAGATIEHAVLFYTGSIALAGGDYTPDLLQSADDAANNGIWVTVGGQKQGPFDPMLRQPNGQSSVGSSAKITPDITFGFGTLQNTKTALYGNRIDVTGLFAGSTGTINFMVHAPENLDVDANTPSNNGGNKAGSATNNSCSSVGNWSLLVVYRDNNESPKQVIVKDDFLQAWDYTYIHKGVWNRPKTTITHAPMAAGSKFYIYGATGLKAGYALPNNPTCTCGCGGLYNLKKTTTQPGSYDKTPYYFSSIHEDPQSVRTAQDPLWRDKHNGPWALNTIQDGSLTSQPINGNDWTLFQSGTKLTEFPNLYEGEAVSADSTQPKTNENAMSVAGETYAGHPWNGRGQVTYHAAGHSISVVGVEPVAEALDLGSTSSTFYFKGDQKDVFKPQARVTVRYIAMTIPVESGSTNNAPVITLSGDNPVNLIEGASFTEPGYSAIDAEDGDITSNVEVNCDLNIGLSLNVGNFSCTYSVTDLDDNTTTVTRNIVVSATPVNQAPSITLSGSSSVTFDAGTSYSDPGYSANDPEDGNITGNVVVSCDFDTNAPLIEGSYVCTYNVQDSQGVDANEVTRTVVVNAVPESTCTDYYATTYAQTNAGRAVKCNGWYACAVGSGDSLGLWNTYTYVTVKETSPGYYELGSCP